MFDLLRIGLRKVRRRIRNERVAQGPSGAGRFWLALTVASAIVFTSFLFPRAHVFAPPSTPQVGDIATDDIVAPFDFPVYKSTEEIEFERREVIGSLPAVMLYDEAIVDSAFRSLDRLFFLADSIKQKLKNVGRAADRLRLFFPYLKDSAVRRLIASDSLRQIKSIIRSGLEDRYLVGVAVADSAVPSNYQTVQVSRQTRNSLYAADQILGLAESRVELRADLAVHLAETSIRADWLYDVASEFLKPNIIYSPEETTRKREEALGAIAQERMWFKAGQRIIAKNERVTKTHLEWMDALAEHRSVTGTKGGLLQYLLPLIARLLFVAFVYLSFLFAYYSMRGKEDLVLVRIFPLLIIILSAVVAGYLITEQAGLSEYMIPVAAGIILVAILYDMPTALLVTLTEAVLFGILYEFNFEISFVIVVTGLVSAFTMRNVKKRSDFYRGALYIAIALAATAYLLESLKFADGGYVITQCGYAIINAAASSFIAMAVLPLFESFFSFTTNITLLELSDMNHPLLKRLALESPGTYHHSLVIGSLCEAAAEAIGANSLLARIGAYYHDVGKMEIPEYFVENQMGLRSKHEELSPTMSAIVIKSHIARGRELAEDHDLPDKIIAFIEEHHGTSLMSYFYNKARELHPDEEISDAEFRYPGPKPQSRETAILMLADSVEAASRTLDDPKPARIQNLIKRLITEKFQSGQLSESSLTLNDLQGIEDAFAKVLMGAFHTRVDYPTPEQEKSV